MSTAPALVVVPAVVSEKPQDSKDKTAKTSLPFSIRTVKRDLKILEETQYQLAVQINSGAQRIKSIDLGDFAPPQELLTVWNATRSKKKPPQIEVFEELGDVIDALKEWRRQLYATARIAILRVHLEARSIHLIDDDLERLALSTEGMSGAELEQQVVLKVAEQAFAAGRPGQVTLPELLTAAGTAHTQSRDPVRRTCMAQQLQWATKNALFASSDIEALTKSSCDH